MNKQRIIIVDDHSIFAKGLSLLLSSYDFIEVLAVKHCGQSALDFLSEFQVEIVLTDLKMPHMDGLELCKIIRKKHPLTKVIALTAWDQEHLSEDLFEAGAKAFLNKNVLEEELIPTIKAVSENKYVYLNQVYDAKEEFLIRSIGSEKLSKREEEIVQYLVKGHTNKRIAETLYISPLTVKTHRAKIMKKLGLNSNAALIRYCLGNSG